jgi:hypothetical protein
VCVYSCFGFGTENGQVLEAHIRFGHMNCGESVEIESSCVGNVQPESPKGVESRRALPQYQRASSVALSLSIAFALLFMSLRLRPMCREGCVEAVMDKLIGKKVFRIMGNVLAANYMRLPKKNTQSLNLTGRFLYTQVRTVPDKYYVLHLYVQGKDDTVLDISITNLFKDIKLIGNVLQYPCALAPKVKKISSACFFMHVIDDGSCVPCSFLLSAVDMHSCGSCGGTSRLQEPAVQVPQRHPGYCPTSAQAAQIAFLPNMIDPLAMFLRARMFLFCFY